MESTGQPQSSADVRDMTFSQRLRNFTPKVLFMTFYLAITAWNFGYDVSIFSGVQAMGPFVERFGTYNETTKKYAIAAYLTSILNSFPYLGKLIGCWVAAPMAERVGRKKSILLIIVVTYIGVLLQITSTTIAQFTIGRMLSYAMTGLVVNIMPAFMAECAPASLRGMVTAQLQMQIVIAQLVASAINYGTSTIKSNAGWRISIGIQFVMPTLLLVLYPLVVESPHWLISRDRTDDAAKSLKKLRQDASEASIHEEINFLSHIRGNEGKGSWKEVFNVHNRRRVIVAIVVMMGQQLTGQAFVSQYSVLFYKEQGYTNNFELGMIQQALGVVANFLTTIIVDTFGRRQILLIGGVANAIFLFIMGAMGCISNPNKAERGLLVASVMLWFFFYILSWASVPYIVLGEVSTRRVVEKSSNLAVSLSVISAFLVSFTAPYLLNAPYANLGGKVGFIYGSLMVLFTVLTFMLVPEMKGRSLEEIDALFAQKVSTRKFPTAEVSVAEVITDDIKEKEMSVVEDTKAG